MKDILVLLNKDMPTFDYRVKLGEINEYQLHFIIPPTQKTYPNIIKHEIKLYGAFSIKKDLKGFWQIFRHLMKHKYAIIIYNSSKYYLVGPILSLLTGNKNNIIIINGFGRVFTSNKYILLRPIFIFLLYVSTSIVKRIIVQNTDDYNHFYRLFPRRINKKVNLIYSGINIYPQKVTFNNENVNVINIARIMQEKGIYNYLSIAKNVKKHNEKIKFTLIGESYGDSKLDRLIESYKNQGIIEYIEFTDNPYKYLIDCNIMLFTSFREGLPRVLLESLSIGLPIIAYDVVGVREIVEHNYNGYLFEPQDSLAIVDKIIYLNQNTQDLNKLSDNAIKSVKDKFSITNYINKMKQIFSEILVPEHSKTLRG